MKNKLSRYVTKKINKGLRPKHEELGCTSNGSETAIANSIIESIVWVKSDPADT